MAPEVLRHRLMLSYDALAANITTDDLIRQLLSTITAPAGRRRSRTSWPCRRRRRCPRALLGMNPDASPRGVAERAAVLRRLELLVSRRLDGLVSGEFLGTGSGPGSEAAGVRPYGPGDEARRIDWNVTARSLAPQVRTTDPDRELETWIVVDRSASLDFGTTVQEKRDVALAATAAFGLLSLQGGNHVQFLVAGGDELERLRPAASRLTVMAALARLHDGPRAQRPPAAGAALTDALETLARLRRRRGRVVVVSDFLDARLGRAVAGARPPPPGHRRAGARPAGAGAAARRHPHRRRHRDRPRAQRADQLGQAARPLRGRRPCPS